MAPSWPPCYSGLGLPYRTNAQVAEQMILEHISETLYILSIHFAGGILLLCGTDEQKQYYLPKLARGEIFFSILYSEENAGSDLGNLTSTATALEGGYFKLNGTKVYSLKSKQSDYALCAARTNKTASKYQGITIFIVPLNAKGVSIEHMPSISDEQFCRVTFNDVCVPEANILGQPDEGWSIINKAISLERTGLDFLIKAIKWSCSVDQAISILMPEKQIVEEFNMLKQQINHARQYVYQLLDYFDHYSKIDELEASVSKLTCSELATAIVNFAYRQLNLIALLSSNEGELVYKALDSAFREAPGLTLSAGTSEMMLETIANQILV